MDPCSRGTVKAFDAERGFGFIKPDHFGPDVYFHVRDIGWMYDPEVGQRVTYREGAKNQRPIVISMADS